MNKSNLFFIQKRIFFRTLMFLASFILFSAGSATIVLADTTQDQEAVIEEPIEIETVGTVFRSYVLRKQLNVNPVLKWEGDVPYNGLPIVIQLNNTAELHDVDGSNLALLDFMYRLGGGKKVKVKGYYEPVTSVGGVVIQMVHATEAKILN